MAELSFIDSSQNECYIIYTYVDIDWDLCLLANARMVQCPTSIKSKTEIDMKLWSHSCSFFWVIVSPPDFLIAVSTLDEYDKLMHDEHALTYIKKLIDFE